MSTNHSPSLIIVLPISQNSPLNPSRQKQIISSSPKSTHSPLFLHGLGLQGSLGSPPEVSIKNQKNVELKLVKDAKYPVGYNRTKCIARKISREEGNGKNKIEKQHHKASLYFTSIMHHV